MYMTIKLVPHSSSATAMILGISYISPRVTSRGISMTNGYNNGDFIDTVYGCVSRCFVAGLYYCLLYCLIEIGDGGCNGADNVDGLTMFYTVNENLSAA